MTATATTATRFIERVSTDFLRRVASNDRATHQAAAIAELERRAFAEQRRAYFSRYAPTTAITAGDLRPGMVITEGGGAVRMVVREVHRLALSGRVLATFSWTDCVTGEVDEAAITTPVMDADAPLLMVRESVPDFTTPAIARP